MNPDWSNRIKEIRVRSESATSGPWNVTQQCDEYKKLVNEWSIPQIGASDINEREDAEFVACSREDISWLLIITDVLSANNDALVTIGREKNAQIDEAIKLHPDLAPIFKNTYWEKF